MSIAQTLTVPDDLVELDSWVLWRYEVRGGKKTKVPYAVTGRKASSINPQDWSAFETVMNVWSRYPNGYSGIGFVFSKSDPFAGIDLDDAIQEAGELKQWAAGIVERFADTYMEISPSGRGLKIWIRGSLPDNVPGAKVAQADGGIEIYDRGRYFTVTGRVFRGAPLQIEDHSKDLLALYGHMTADRKHAWPVQPQTDGRIPYGQQHNTLVSIAGTLRRRRVCDAAIEACLLAIAKHQCERPMEPDHISRIVRSTRGWIAK